MKQTLLADTTITYKPTKFPAAAKTQHTRRARLFPGSAGTPVCVVTQTPKDDGVVSITNAAEDVLAAVAAHRDLGRGRAIVIEHYSADTHGGEQFALVSGTVVDSATWEIVGRESLDRYWPGLADQL